MKIFISWSGTRSKALAKALHTWLPMVLQYVEPFVSESDIDAGERWAEAVSSELEASNFGIICITPENLSSEWLLFEAGALSKSMQDAKVIPLLFDLEFSDISGPLSQFQAKKVDQAGLNEVIEAINKIAEKPADESIVKTLVPALWSEFEKLAGKIPDKKTSDRHMRTQKEILEELVTGVRGLDSKFRGFEAEINNDRPRRLKHLDSFHPMQIEELSFHFGDKENPVIGILMVAGLVREDAPWLAEILTETYRDMKHGPTQVKKTAYIRLQRIVETLHHGPFLDEFFGHSKGSHMMGLEISRILMHLMHTIPPIATKMPGREKLASKKAKR